MNLKLKHPEPDPEHKPDRPSIKHMFRNILLVFTVFLLALALPYALSENLRLGTWYLFTDRFWDDVVLRFQSAGRFRFMLQPCVAMILGAMNGRIDAARGRYGFLSRIISRKSGWKESVGHGLNTISILLIVGILADILFQFASLDVVHVIPALLLGPLFVSVPYAVARGISSRIVTRSSLGGKP